MTLNEINNTYPSYHFMREYITIREAKDRGLIPAIYQDPNNPEGGVFPDHCTCGSENVISLNLKRAKCCNPRCPVKMGYALSEMFTRFGIKGVGDAICAKMVKGTYDKLQYKSHVEILMLEPADYPISVRDTVAAYDFYRGTLQMKSRELTFPDLIANLGIEGLGSNSKKLFEGIQSFDQLAEEIKRVGNTKMYCIHHGVADENVMANLYIHLIDIAVAEFIFASCLRRTGMINIPITITGRIYLNGVHYTKEEFVRYCNNIARLENGEQLFEIQFKNKALESVQFIVADTPSNSAKYRAGLRRNNLITGQAFVDYIKEEVEKCQKKLQELEMQKKQPEMLEQEKTEPKTTKELGTLQAY